MSLTQRIPESGAPEPTIADLVRAYTRPLVRAAALVLPFATCVATGHFRDNVTSATVALTLVVWIVGAAATGDRLAGLMAAVSGGVWFDFFLTAPYHRLT